MHHSRAVSKYRCSAMSIVGHFRTVDDREPVCIIDTHWHCSAFLSMWHTDIVVCVTCHTVIWLTTRLLYHRRHPALFARFDEANSRFAFAFAFHVGCLCVRARSRTYVYREYQKMITILGRMSAHVCASLRMSLVTLRMTPGFALTIPSYQHWPPCIIEGGCCCSIMPTISA